MKVTVKDKFLNIRAGSPSLNAPCYQYLAPGSIIDVDGKLYKGDMYDGDDFWLKDEGDNYYWIGGVHHSIPSDAFLKFAPPVTKQVTYSWFDHLNIKHVWDTYKAKGAGASVAILDTGYSFTNTDLASKIGDPQKKMLLQPDDYPGVQLIMNDQHRDRHGTRCASIVGAANKRDWIIGIAPEASLLIAKLSISGALPKFKYILDGISWAIDKGADIVSVSYFETLTTNEAAVFQQQLSQLVQGKDILIFACSGNTNVPNTSADYYPASFKDCVSVGASTLDDRISPITVLSGATVLHAPGESIESYGPGDTPSPLSGTSFSTPIIAGIAALAVSYLKAKNGGWDKTTLLSKMISTADPINGNQHKKIINTVKLFKNL